MYINDDILKVLRDGDLIGRHTEGYFLSEKIHRAQGRLAIKHPEWFRADITPIEKRTAILTNHFAVLDKTAGEIWETRETDKWYNSKTRVQHMYAVD
ncbi:unnamed protein product, partial [marine sediment metagenome]